jgi:hypothetical protein
MYVLLIVVCTFVLFLLAIVLSVPLRYTDSDCIFGIFWPLCCLFFFGIRILITSLWYLQTLLEHVTVSFTLCWLSCVCPLVYLLWKLWIIWFSSLSILSGPEEGYFEWTWRRLFWADLKKVILSGPEEGYFERTWRRLFWAELNKVI